MTTSTETMTDDVSNEIETGSEADQTPSPGETESASSSDAAVDEKTTADAIREAFLAEEEEGDPDPSKDGDDDPEADQSKDGKDDSDTAQKPEETDQDDLDDEFRIPDEEFKGLSKGVKRRIGMLSKKVRTLTEEVDAAKSAVESVQSVETFVRDNNIEPKNVTLAYQLMAQLSNGDFQGFMDGLKPWIDYARSNLGEIIPDDLQAAIENGEITDEHARRIVRSEAQGKRHQQQTERQQQTQRHQDIVGQVTRAVDAREAELKMDPDFAALAPQVKAVMTTMMQNGAIPRTPEEGVKLLDDAFKVVKETAAPKRRQDSTPKTPEAQPSNTGRKAPTSTFEAIQQALIT